MTRPRRRRTPSSIDRLEKPVRELIGQLRIEHGWTIDEILAKLLELGQGVSRSALGRHVKSLEEIGAQLRHSREVANALVQQLGDAPEDKTAQLNIELMQTMVMRMLTATNDGGDGQPLILTAEDQMFMGRTLQSLASARKTDADMKLKIRQEAVKEAAKRAGDAAKQAGLSADSVTFIRKAVLGSDA